MEIVYLNEPFKIQELPLTKVYVLDDWLAQPLHHFYDEQISHNNIWSKTNQVAGGSSTGLPHHSFWGATFFRNVIKLQASWRGHAGRKRALAVQNSLPVQLKKTMHRSVQQINTTIKTQPDWAAGMSRAASAPQDQDQGACSAVFMKDLVASLEQVSAQLTRVENQKETMIQTMMQRLGELDSKLNNNSRGPPLGVQIVGPPPLPLKD